MLDVTKHKANPTIIGLTLIGIVLVWALVEKSQKTARIDKCPVYTIGYVTRLYTNRGIHYINYQFRLDNQAHKHKQSVSNFDTGDSWFVDQRKLAKRKLLLKVNCADKNENTIVWDVAVPDTIGSPPVSGWSSNPFEK